MTNVARNRQFLKPNSPLDSGNEEAMACECTNFAIMTMDDIGKHHHRRCDKYETEKHPYLMVFAEGINSWIPAKDGGFIDDYTNHLDDGDEMELKFKRKDMTDKEYANLATD